MSDYYGYHPTITLARSFAVIGLPYSGHRIVGHRLSALTGLPLCDLDRLVEHEVSCSLHHYISLAGEKKYQEIENKILQKTVNRQPHGIVILGDSTLLNQENLRLVKDNCDLAHLDCALKRIFQRLKQCEEKEQPPQPFVPYPLQSQKQLLSWSKEREESYRFAKHKLFLKKGINQEILEFLQENLPTETTG